MGCLVSKSALETRFLCKYGACLQLDRSCITSSCVPSQQQQQQQHTESSSDVNKKDHHHYLHHHHVVVLTSSTYGVLSFKDPAPQVEKKQLENGGRMVPTSKSSSVGDDDEIYEIHVEKKQLDVTISSPTEIMRLSLPKKNMRRQLPVIPGKFLVSSADQEAGEATESINLWELMDGLEEEEEEELQPAGPAAAVGELQSSSSNSTRASSPKVNKPIGKLKPSDSKLQTPQQKPGIAAATAQPSESSNNIMQSSSKKTDHKSSNGSRVGKPPLYPAKLRKSSATKNATRSLQAAAFKENLQQRKDDDDDDDTMPATAAAAAARDSSSDDGSEMKVESSRRTAAELWAEELESTFQNAQLLASFELELERFLLNDEWYKDDDSSTVLSIPPGSKNFDMNAKGNKIVESGGVMVVFWREELARRQQQRQQQQQSSLKIPREAL